MIIAIIEDPKKVAPPKCRTAIQRLCILEWLALAKFNLAKSLSALNPPVNARAKDYSSGETERSEDLLPYARARLWDRSPGATIGNRGFAGSASA